MPSESGFFLPYKLPFSCPFLSAFHSPPSPPLILQSDLYRKWQTRKALHCTGLMCQYCAAWGTGHHLLSGPKKHAELLALQWHARLSTVLVIATIMLGSKLPHNLVAWHISHLLLTPGSGGQLQFGWWGWSPGSGQRLGPGLLDTFHPPQTCVYLGRVLLSHGGGQKLPEGRAAIHKAS